MEYLNETQLKNYQTLFTSTPHSDLSDKYVHIPTYKVVEDMNKLGWFVKEVTEVKSRGENKGFGKHLVTFENPDLVIEGKEKLVPQILLINSHDGKSSFKFHVGIFRFICKNGLVIPEVEFAPSIKIRHMGYSFEELNTQINIMINNIPNVLDKINGMASKTITDKQKEKLVLNALESRFSQDIEELKFDIQDILTPIRKEDELDNLWTTFNVVQEKVIKGNFRYTTSKGKSRKARPIKNINHRVNVNQDIFNDVLEFIN